MAGNSHLTFIASVLVVVTLLAHASGQTTVPIQVDGPEQQHVDITRVGGGVPPVPGVANYQVFRASKGVPDLTDKKGWTYHHHVDLADWKGRLYLGWDSCETHEDTWPSRELYSTSEDGIHWSPPQELFPQGVSTPLRIYFFHAPNGRMLAIAGKRVNQEKTSEDMKGPLVVREIKPDHSLGNIYTLIAPQGTQPTDMYSGSGDAGFVEASNQLLANRPFLEEQDYGKLLATRRMKWHEPASWPPNQQRILRDFGKAFSFYHRKDGALVGIGKRGFVVVSTDEGENWTVSMRPPTLVTGNAKVWGQRTSDGRYALVYNPHVSSRFPLIVVSGDDGINFGGMRTVFGQKPLQRYVGENRSPGPQYVRGISEWAGDGSWQAKDKAMWVAHSVNKEDIWVSRIPVPISPNEAPASAPWSIYSPLWAPATVQGEGVRLEDRDPYDAARAERGFTAVAKVRVETELSAAQNDKGSLDVTLAAPAGATPVRITLSSNGKLLAVNGKNQVEIGAYRPDEAIALAIEADCATKKFTVSIAGRPVLSDADFAEPADNLGRLRFQTADTTVTRGPVDPATDVPSAPVMHYQVKSVKIGQ